MSLRLRPVVDADENFLFTLRTDPEVARQSSAPSPTRLEHAQWFAARPLTRALYVVEEDVEMVGMVRLDLLPASKTAWVSLALCPRVRGRGYGAEVLRLVEAEAQAQDIQTLHAWVKPQNMASLKTFDSAGYDFVGRGPELCFASKEVRCAS